MQIPKGFRVLKQSGRAVAAVHACAADTADAEPYHITVSRRLGKQEAHIPDPGICNDD